jgi:hypothetical protein
VLDWESVRVLDYAALRTLVTFAWLVTAFLFGLGTSLEQPQLLLLTQLSGQEQTWSRDPRQRSGTTLASSGHRTARQRLRCSRFPRCANPCSVSFLTLLMVFRPGFSMQSDTREMTRGAAHSRNCGICQPPKALSISSMTASTVSSCQGRPTICTPMGVCSAVVPARTTPHG